VRTFGELGHRVVLTSRDAPAGLGATEELQVRHQPASRRVSLCCVRFVGGIANETYRMMARAIICRRAGLM
jgi:hypothetical protein